MQTDREDMTGKTQQKRPKKRRPLVSGVILLGIGLYLWGHTSNLLPPIKYSWPLLIIVLGLALVAGSIARKNRSTNDQLNPPVS